MELIEAINSRRSVRHYTHEQVSKTAIEALLQAAVQAPSAMNRQPWAYAVIQDKTLLTSYSARTKQYLLDSLDKMPVFAKYKAMFENPEFNIFYDAGTLILILAKDEGTHTVEDCCLAAQNLMLAAHGSGLGSCWIGFSRFLLNMPEVQAELGIPAGYKVVAPIIVGYPQAAVLPIAKKPPVILFWK